MNPQVSYGQTQGPRLNKPIKIALVAIVIIGALVGAAALATLFIKPGSPEKITDADTVSFASISSLPSGFTQTSSKGITLVNQKDGGPCTLSFGILPNTQYSGNAISDYLAQVSSELRTKGWEVSDGIETDAVSVASTKGDKTYKIPTQQINYTDGFSTVIANMSVQKLKNKKFLSVTQTCSAFGTTDPAAYMNNMSPVIKLLKVDVAVTKK